MRCSRSCRTRIRVSRVRSRAGRHRSQDRPGRVLRSARAWATRGSPRQTAGPRKSLGTVAFHSKGRVALGALFAVGLSQWPYRTQCGWPLFGYTAVVALMLVVGGWCALASWRHHMGAAHLVSLGLVFWGIVLGAEVLLPRIGYSVDSETWRCPTPAVARPAPIRATPPASVPAVQDPTAAGDPDEAGPTVALDSLTSPDSADVTAEGETPPDSVPG